MSRFNNLSIEPPVPAPDSDEQLVIGDERAFIELQEIPYVKELGARCLEIAEVYLNVAIQCREALQEWEEVPARRRKPIDLARAVPDLLPELNTGAEG